MRRVAKTLSQSGVVSFINYLLENPSLGCKLIRCFHKVEGSEAEYLKRVWSVAQERGFSQVDKLDAELSKTSHSDEEEEQSPLRDLFDLYLVFAFVSNIPWTCLMVLATTVLEACGPDVPQRAAALQSMAVTLRSWTEADIEKAGKIVKTAPSYRETNALLDVGGVDLVGVRGLVELLKLMPQDTLLLSRSLIGASDRQLYLIALVLTQFGVMDQGLFELKQAIDLPGGPLASAAVALVGMTKVAVTSPIKKPSRALPAPPAAATIREDPPVGGRLVLKTPPNTNTVYHKLLKPFPTVSIEGVDNLHDCMITAELLRYEGEGVAPYEPLHYLEGEKAVIVNDGVAIFRKLKINATTTSVGNQFVLKFTLVRNVNDTLVPIGDLSTITGPLNVFSHSSYLKEKDASAVGAKPPKEKRRKKVNDEEMDSE